MTSGLICYSLGSPKNLEEAQYIDGTAPIIINTTGALRVPAAENSSLTFCLIGTPAHYEYNYGSPSTLTKITKDAITTINDFWFQAQISSNSQLRIQIAICDPTDTFPSSEDSTKYIYDMRLFNSAQFYIPQISKITLKKDTNIVIKVSYYTGSGGSIFLSYHSTSILDD